MNFNKTSAGLTLLTLLSGCAADVLYSHKSSAPVGDVSRINVIFVGSNVQKDPAQVLGLNISEKFPLIFSANGIDSEAKSLPPAEIPNAPSEYRTLFSAKSDAGLILHMKPIATATQCYGGCFVSMFRIQTNLTRAQTGKLVWTATIDLPNNETRWSNDSAVAEKFANTILERLRIDRVIPPKQ